MSAMWCGQNGLNCKICQFFMCVLSDEKIPMMKLRNKVHLSAFFSFGVKSLISNGTDGVEQGVISHSFCLYVTNFRHSVCSRTQNVNKRADWLTLFTLVHRGRITMVANRFLYEIDVSYRSERINFDARRCNRSIVRMLLTV